MKPLSFLSADVGSSSLRRRGFLALVCLALLVAFAEAQQASDEFRDWRTDDGRTAELAFVRLDGENVVLKKRDGTMGVFSFNRLSEEDQAWVRNHLATMQPGLREIAKFSGHTGGAHSVSISADGRLAVSGGGDHTVRLWNIAGMELARECKGHEDAVVAVAFSPDGQIVASAGKDKTIRLWDVRNGRQLRQISHDGVIHAIAFSPGGDQVAGGGDNLLAVWDAKTGDRLRELKGHDNAVRSVCFSPDGLRLLSASSDKSVRIWDVRTGEELHRYDQNGLALAALFTPNAKQVLVASSTNAIGLRDAETGKTTQLLGGYKGSVHGIAILPSGKYAASAHGGGWTGLKLGFADGALMMKDEFKPDLDSAIRLWDLETGKLIEQATNHTKAVSSLAVSLDGNYLVSGSGDGTVRLWSLSRKTE